MPFDSNELAWAAEIVARHMAPTPQYVWPLLCDSVGAEVWVKHENHTPIGSFKVRGGLVYFERLRSQRPEIKGIITATRGNHGQSMAFAGRAVGADVVIVVPKGNNPDKNTSMRSLGAELIEHGHDFQESVEFAQALAIERDLEMVNPYHPDLVLGVATYSKELLDAAGELDVVYIPVGMGSGICGMLNVRDLLGFTTEVVGVVAKEAPATALSFAAGHLVSTDTADTFIDGVAVRTPNQEAMSLIISGAARIVTISEDEAAEAMRELYRTTHNVAEPAGALALAGLLAERDRVRGKRVGIIHSGGNADTKHLVEVLSGHTPAP